MPDYTADVLNAVSSLKAYADADPQRIGMWGYSIGGQITLRAMVVSGDIKAGVIWAGVVVPYPDLIARWDFTRNPDHFSEIAIHHWPLRNHRRVTAFIQIENGQRPHTLSAVCCPLRRWGLAAGLGWFLPYPGQFNFGPGPQAFVQLAGMLHQVADVVKLQF